MARWMKMDMNGDDLDFVRKLMGGLSKLAHEGDSNRKNKTHEGTAFLGEVLKAVALCYCKPPYTQALRGEDIPAER